MEINDIYNNSQYNLRSEINEDIDADNNFWGVDEWPNPGGWDGELVDEGHYEEVTYCHRHFFIGPRHCHTETVWDSDLNWYDGFKQLAKLEGVNEDEIKSARVC